MDNDDLPVGTVYSRREALVIAAKSGLSLSALGLLGPATALGRSQEVPKKVNLVASPALTEGPFFVDEKLNRVNLLEGTFREAVIKGSPLALELVVLKLTNDKAVPFEGCQVDVWHCDTKGVYSDEDHPMNHENTAGQRWLRGHQLADKGGKVQFKTIFPGWYPGRTTHIHFKVRTFSNRSQVTADFTSQLFFHEKDIQAVYKSAPYSGQDVPDTINMRDGIFAAKQADGTIAGQHLLLDVQKESGTFRSRFTIILSDKNFREQRGGSVDLVNSWASF